MRHKPESTCAQTPRQSMSDGTSVTRSCGEMASMADAMREHPEYMREHRSGVDRLTRHSCSACGVPRGCQGRNQGCGM